MGPGRVCYPNVCYAWRQCRRRHRNGVIIIRFELRYDAALAAGDCPDERMSLRDAWVRSKLRRYIGSLLDKDSCRPFPNRALVAGAHAPSLKGQPDTTGSAVPYRLG